MTDFESVQKTAKKLRVHRLQHGEFIANEIDLHNLVGDIRLNTKKTIVVIPLGEVEKLENTLKTRLQQMGRERGELREKILSILKRMPWQAEKQCREMEELLK